MHLKRNLTMKRIPRTLIGLTILGALLAVLPAASYAAPNCSGRVVCEHTLGIALTRPAGWQRIPAAKVAPHEIDLALPGTHLNANLRLVVRAFGVGSITNSRAAARHAATKLIAAERATGVTQTSARYAGSAAVVLRGLPGPGPATDILLGRGRIVYLIILPGRVPAPDQQAALNSLRFIPRVGRFPGDVSGGR
jgi:hypothetical protein